MITLLAATVLLVSGGFLHVETSGLQYVPPRPPPCQYCPADSSSGKPTRIFFGGGPCCDSTEDTPTPSELKNTTGRRILFLLIILNPVWSTLIGRELHSVAPPVSLMP